MLPGSDTCQVWWARTADARDELLAVLPAAERDRHRAYVRANDRALYLVAHALTRLLLAERLEQPPADIVFSRVCVHCGADHGKPLLPGSGWETSLSHSGGWVAVALAAGHPVGVDVEWIDRALDVESLRDTVLAQAEQRVLAAGPPEGFFTYWCRKEALLKATGDGLAISPARLRVSGPAEPARLLDWTVPGRPAPLVRLTDLRPDPDHVGCVAILTDRDVTVTEHDGSALLAKT
ncbi:4'-phosphopantetheinyl transferase superfamily protein [Fodinicola feengrottensis]|uniref:4'-phosphopantetheinyl transferase superfamily protein n=1 Tax=Fodinicola feengrottensis TaxID=435914 RepID=A0ABN2IH79_9ACTN